MFALCLDRAVFILYAEQGTHTNTLVSCHVGTQLTWFNWDYDKLNATLDGERWVNSNYNPINEKLFGLEI